MTKQSGIGDQLFIAGYDISGDVGSIDRCSSNSEALDITAINASGHERLLGRFDGEISFAHYFNDASLQEHVALAAKGSGADRVVTYFRSSAIGNVAAGLVAKQINYDWDRPADGSLTGKTQCLASNKGLDWCEQLTVGKRTDTGATNGASRNNGGSSSTGLAAYLQVFSFTGTDATVKIEASSNDGGGDPYAMITGGAFAQIEAGNPAPTAERICTALDQAVEQYLRVVTSTTGGFSSLIFAVCATREPVVL